jgi:hypothetical protein
VGSGAPIATTKYLRIYLNDHLAGATGGVEVARRAAGENRGTPRGDALERLATEIEDDRRALLEIMRTLGVGEDRVKSAFAWLGEKAGRLKLNGELRSYSPLSTVVELEVLALGVRGKLLLWHTLGEIADAEPRLDPARISALAERAESQLDQLDQLRIEAARAAFVS